MKTHFRILETPKHQVLLTKDFDNESDDAPFLVVISFFIEIAKFDLKMSYSSEEKRDNVFDSIDETKVKNTIENIINSLEQ